MVAILTTVIDGSYISMDESFPELMLLLDSTSDHRIRWIPWHLDFLLKTVASSRTSTCSQQFRLHLKTISHLLGQFKSSKNQSGDGWESLFTAVLLIRVLVRLGSSGLLSLSDFVQTNQSYRVTFNHPIKLPDSTHYGDIDDPATFLKCIDDVEVNCATVAIYFPPHVQFKKYDLFVRIWDQYGRIICTNGYQLKEGRQIPRIESDTDLCDTSYVVRGKSAQSSATLRNWEVPGERRINDFFGVSGEYWTPLKWEQLRGG